MVDYYGLNGDWSPFPTYKNCIWTNGCYDILHLGHLELLAKCREESNKLENCLVFVGLDSDKRVRNNKGKDRPINNEISRISMLLSLKYVDGVFLYDTDEELDDLIKEVNPNKMIIGEEYRDKKIIGKDNCKDIMFFPKIKNLSTSNIIKKIKK